MLSTVLGTGGYVLITDSLGTTLISAFTNDSNARQYVTDALIRSSLFDNEGENLKYHRVYINPIDAFVNNSTNLQVNLAGNIANPNTTEYTESLWTKADNTALEYSSGLLTIKDDGVDRAHLNANCGGRGITQDVNGALELDLTDGTLAFTGDTIGVGTIDATNIANNAVNENHIKTSVAGDGLTGGAGSALAVNVDNVGLEIAADILQLKDTGIATAKYAAESVTRDKVNENLQYFTNLITVSAETGYTGSNNRLWWTHNFDLIGIRWHVEKAVAGGDMTISIIENGNAEGVLTIANGSAQDTQGNFTAFTTITPLPIDDIAAGTHGTNINYIELVVGGAATAGVAKLSLVCRYRNA